ncbi:MAG: AtpZ/AtpI family protein [Pseudobdellovibrionaceae bacterium]
MKNKYLVFVVIGIELVAIVVGCLLIGQKIDEHYGTKGFAMIGLSMAGLTGWLYQIIQMAKRADSQPEE